MNVLSLFDGCSVGLVALKKIGVKVDNYFASEIEDSPIKVSLKNHPEIIHLGDVKNQDNWDLPKIDLIIGGSPCQGFSFAGKQLNFEDPRSALFFEFEKAIKKFKPKYFMLENTKMSKVSESVITEILKVKPKLINSSLFTAQNRERLYWTNINFDELPKDLGIKISDVTGIESIAAAMRGRYVDQQKTKTKQFIELRNDEKSNCLTTASKNALFVNKKDVINGKNSYSVDEINWEYLNSYHYELLQGLEPGYTNCVSETNRRKMLGNGWTVAVIAHILKGLKEDK